ncbi:trans-aconitate 2-methyltransferase [Pandoraea anhela]|uniref:Trans-aconitate 2-methyltransferase n=1 Tax=Pandoraea anhela TaxID=2508295 RepID=A0A5E4W9H3_9BURK|nr:trans-aconitate 2-methyltransferase [Pandoraea anhela]VVE20499.1 trans-aconitate 2-methyltransferase [Pandoraea anhela]
MTWSSKQYSQFERERTRPVRDLLSAVPTTDAKFVVDLGCGPGNSTEVLIDRFPGADALGLDNSADMVDAARKRLPDVRFDLADIGAWRTDTPCDVILANAVFQWVPNHADILPKIASMLAPGGSLALQMPDNLDEPAHRLMREVAAESPWAEKLANAAAAREALPDVAWYYALLRAAASHVDIWRTTYHHLLTGGSSAVVEWFKGSGLRPYLAPLTEAERAEYLTRYEARIADAYPALPDGTVVLPFPRLFLVATR